MMLNHWEFIHFKWIWKIRRKAIKESKKFISYAISIDEYWNNIVIPKLFDLDDKWKIVVAKLKEAKESKLKIN